MGHAKAGGNYAGVLRWSGQAKTEGFDITLHLDSARHEEVDEFSLCGFLGVKRPSHGVGDDVGDDDDDVTLVVPDSQCAIESLTSDSVQHIARSWGWKVHRKTAGPLHRTARIQRGSRSRNCRGPDSDPVHHAAEHNRVAINP